MGSYASQKLGDYKKDLLVDISDFSHESTL